tara:strand:- start:3676 stop:4587 length:912 start_codon:yes stop_codon:yes gene_type:complete
MGTNRTQNLMDSVRRIVSKWVNTTRPLTEDAEVGDSIVTVNSTKRFQVNDEVMIRDALYFETGFRVEEIIDNTRIRLSESVISQDWTVEQNSVLVKTINEMFVQGIYFGDPEVIPQFPAITVFASDKTSEWMTLDSTTEGYNLQINVYVLDSTHEDGHRFLHEVTDTIETGLKKNIYPLVGDFDTTSLLADAVTGDFFLKVMDSSLFTEGNRVLIENSFELQEIYVREIIDSTTIQLWQSVHIDYDRDETVIIIPTRFIYNSWPASVDFGKIHKGDLLQASTISWFASEEEMQFFRLQDPQLL